MTAAQEQAEKVTWLAVVSGRVQGVCYRSFTQAAARQLGITGWVRNERNSNVTAVLQHDDTQVLGALVEQLKDGPPSAWVDLVEVAPMETTELFDSFTVSFTGLWHER